MRRHAEGLVILSGAAPSRQWRKPIQLMDVVRAAVAEVEDYERIEVRRLPRIGVGGPAVADLTHLIAELLENATVFSPPHTAVQVLGERVSNGFTLEIHDRGLGMPPEVLLDANLRLAETPTSSSPTPTASASSWSDRLAQRQNVRVSPAEIAVRRHHRGRLHPRRPPHRRPGHPRHGLPSHRRAERAIGSGRGTDTAPGTGSTSPGGDRRGQPAGPPSSPRSPPDSPDRRCSTARSNSKARSALWTSPATPWTAPRTRPSIRPWYWCSTASPTWRTPRASAAASSAPATCPRRRPGPARRQRPGPTR
ncbi:hypothetical protein SMICM304S_02887 [Streptomyces microflavus]